MRERENEREKERRSDEKERERERRSDEKERAFVCDDNSNTQYIRYTGMR